MTCQHIDNAIICTGGQDYKILDAKGKVWRFEMHPHCGPIVLTRQTGEVSEVQPPENSPFWECVSFWDSQGRKLNVLGACEWKRPKISQMSYLYGNHYLLEPT
jgi:hypothetical protein